MQRVGQMWRRGGGVVKRELFLRFLRDVATSRKNFRYLHLQLSAVLPQCRRRLTDATRLYADTQDGKVPHLRWPNALRVFEFSISCSRVSWPGMQDGLQWKSKELRSRGILKWHLIKRTHVSAEFANSLLIKELCYSLWVRSPHLVEAIFHLSPPHMWKGVACGWIRWWWWVPINSLVFASRRRMWEKFSSQVN